MPPHLFIQLLGGFQLSADGAPVIGLNSVRIQSLLTYLILNRTTPQPRRSVAFSLWPDSNENQALANLRNLFYLLRNSLPAFGQYLETDWRTLRWSPGASACCDVVQFEEAIARAGSAVTPPTRHAALEEAAACYHGDLFPDCYAEWIAPQRERLRQNYLYVLEQLIQVLESLGDYTAAIQRAQTLQRYDPLREATWRLLMRLHALNGDRAGVLNAYYQCSALLSKELGVEPSENTSKTRDQLLEKIAGESRRGKSISFLGSSQTAATTSHRQGETIPVFLAQPEGAPRSLLCSRSSPKMIRARYYPAAHRLRRKSRRPCL